MEVGTFGSVNSTHNNPEQLSLGNFCLVPLLCGAGLYFTLRLRFVQVRKFGLAVKYTFGQLSFSGAKAGKDGMSSFQALATAVAAQVGTGNVVGVATALTMGGPGALFWIWCAAFLGMATIFAEAVLAQTYKVRRPTGEITGGPAYYISEGLKCKPLAGVLLDMHHHRPRHGRQLRPVELHR